MASNEGSVGLGALAAELHAFGPYVNLTVSNLSRQFGARGVALVRQYASGRPGPEVITGEYLASIQWSFEVTGTGVSEVKIGSDAPQAMRLEYGFVGSDSLGRDYDQPPFPHFAPAAAVLEQEFPVAIELVLDAYADTNL